MNYNIIKQIIDTWDPIELLKVSAPKDEYDDEIKQIISKISGDDNIGIIGKVIFDVFSTSFGEGTFNKTLEDCIIVAKQMMSYKN